MRILPHPGLPGVVTLVLVLAGAVRTGAAPARAAGNDDCLGCHGAGADVVDLDAQHRVDAAAFAASIHAAAGLGCIDCHAGKGDFPHAPDAAPARCSTCHADAAKAFAGSVHGHIGDKRNGSSPFPAADPCAKCHGVHDVRAVDDAQSRVYFRNIPKTCGSCHQDLAIVGPGGLTTAPFDDYQKSVHGLKLEDPNAKPAVCTDCHGSHDIKLAKDPSSPINPFNVPATCGLCHKQEFADFSGSVHGLAAARGVTAAPTCPDCHGIHTIKLVAAAGATPAEERLVRTTCPACHASDALTSARGVKDQRVASYFGSYHGLASKRGSERVADCASCHGIHAIYPSSDPRSRVAAANLQTTCGGCHPGASVQFTRGPVHFQATGEASQDVVIARWVSRVYWVLLFAVIGGMLAHNAIILSWHVRRRLRDERAGPERLRFSRTQMAQHAILTVSFFTLVFTGFMLAYPDTWWSRLFLQLGLTESTRRWVHRVAALVMIAAGLQHVIWALFTPYGRAEIRRILPRLRDWDQLRQNLRFHLGRSDLPAAFAKYDYPAKAEYWALVWGTVVMALTGFVLWFPVWATSLFPFWIVKVSQVIHLFEAWLATLAILVFHFFYVIAHPEIYPLSFAMFRGTMPAAHARHHHPQWVEEEASPAPVAAPAAASGSESGAGASAKDTTPVG
jgi:formate dehydrogenase gamma subunit